MPPIFGIMPASVEQVRAALADHYAVERLLGSGGMADVFLAQDLKHSREVAIKVLKPELAAGLGPDRFLREIEISAQLVHPHILTLIDSGEAQGIVYYVMPFVHGESLRERLERETQLPLDETLWISREVADALSYAHSQGFVHRDVKPENIMFEAGHALVTDFGIARAVGTAGGATLTETGLAVGTPTYMSPEQASGEQRIDFRSDVYSLGCVVYEMLTGEPPFTGATTDAVLARKSLEEVPSIRVVRPAVPRAVEAAVHKALARTPADRFASALQFVEALDAAPSEAEREAPAKSVAVLPFANMSADPENEYFCDGIAEEIINALAQLPELRVAGRTSAFSFKGVDQDLREIGVQLNVATVLEGSVRRAGNRLRITAQLVDVNDGYHLWSERFDRQLEDVFAIQDEIARSIAERLQVTLGVEAGARLARPHSENVEAYQLCLKGRALLYQRGMAMLQSRECFEQALVLDPDFPLAHAGLADSYSIPGYYGMVEPTEAWPRARSAAQRALALAPELAEAHNAMAIIALGHDWDWATAEREFRCALELNPGYVQARCWYPLLYLQCVRGRHEEAIAEARRAVDVDPLSPYTHAILGNVLANAGRGAEAIEEARRGVEADAAAYYNRWVLGLAYHADSRFPDAEAAYTQALTLSGRHPWALATLGRLYADSARPAEASAVRAELLARSQREYIQPTVLALAAASVGESEEALALLHRACDERDAFLAFSSVGSAWSAWLRPLPRFEEILSRMGLAG